MKALISSNGKEKERDSNNIHNNGNDNNQYFDEIVALKENVLRLDSERSMLQDVLSQREKKIELLEEDMRGPVPYETARYGRYSIFYCDLYFIFFSCLSLSFSDFYFLVFILFYKADRL